MPESPVEKTSASEEIKVFSPVRFPWVPQWSDVLADFYRAIEVIECAPFRADARRHVDSRGIMCVRTNRAGTASTAPPRQQEGGS